MLPAKTLIHRAAMDIGLPAVQSFARYFSATHRLEIHTDGSLDQSEQRLMLHAATGLEAVIVTPADRKSILDERLANYPKSRALMDGVGYNAKLELPMAASEPYFYFDSDIVWLRHVVNLIPPTAPNAFSTESWSWYNGVANDQLWIEAKTPRRVNSGFYYLGENFPFECMEDMLTRGMFDPGKRYNTDQEIMAYLFRNMELYHPEDLKRSRRNVRYDLATDAAAALHFPGGMWTSHMNQINRLQELSLRNPQEIRFQQPSPLTRSELLRMRTKIKLSDSSLLGRPLNWLRKLREKF